MNRIEYQILENQITIMEALKFRDDTEKIMKVLLHQNIIRTQRLIDDKLNENEQELKSE